MLYVHECRQIGKVVRKWGLVAKQQRVVVTGGSSERQLIDHDLDRGSTADKGQHWTNNLRP